MSAPDPEIAVLFGKWDLQSLFSQAFPNFLLVILDQKLSELKDENQVTILKEKNANLQEKLENSRREVELHRNIITDLRNQNKDLKTKLEQSLSNEQELGFKIQDLKREVWKRDCDAGNDHAKDDHIRKLEDKVRQLQNTLLVKQEDQKMTDKHIRHLQSKVDNDDFKYEPDVAELEKQNSYLRKKVQQLTRECEKRDHDIGHLEEAVTFLKETKFNLNCEKKFLHQFNMYLKSQSAAIKKKLRKQEATKKSKSPSAKQQQQQFDLRSKLSRSRTPDFWIWLHLT